MKIIAYLNFDGNCRQAMTFYQQCLGAELVVMPFVDAQGQPDTAPDARIMHARIDYKGQPVLMASDTPPDGSLKRGNNFSVSVHCDSMEEIQRLFAAFSKKAEVTLPLADMFWGAHFGMLNDQYGIHWMFNHELKR